MTMTRREPFATMKLLETKHFIFEPTYMKRESFVEAGIRLSLLDRTIQGHRRTPTWRDLGFQKEC